MPLVDFLGAVVIIALLDAFIFILLDKWSIREYLQVHADSWFQKITHRESDFLNKLFSCSFCTAWWISVFLCVFSSLISGCAELLLVPFLSTPLTRHLL